MCLLYAFYFFSDLSNKPKVRESHVNTRQIRGYSMLDIDIYYFYSHTLPMQETTQPSKDNPATITASPPANEPVQDNESISKDTQAIITVILLVFMYPIGFIVMWVWTEWPIWLRLLLSIPVILLIIFLFALPSMWHNIGSNIIPTPIFGVR